MKTLVNRLLRRAGLQLRRLPPRPTSPPVDPAEIAEVEQILEAFSATQPSDDFLRDPDNLRSYLSDGRIAFFNELLRTAERLGVTLSGRRIADLGCGPGYLLRLIDQRAEPSFLLGLDSSVETNELARMMCPRATIMDDTIENIDETFDVIFCTEVLEHLVDPAAALRQMVDCLAPEGALVATVPDGRVDTHAPLAMREDGSAYWGHIHFWSPESWPLFLNASLGEGFRVQTMRMDWDKNLGVISRKPVV